MFAYSCPSQHQLPAEHRIRKQVSLWDPYLTEGSAPTYGLSFPLLIDLHEQFDNPTTGTTEP